jgi:hypothetical protein
MIDLRFVEASRVDSYLIEETFDLQADESVHPGPGKKSDHKDAGIMRGVW